MTAVPGLIVDNFAGGGGASTGIEAALGRAVDLAINHDEQAIRMHEANHPGTRHIRNNIWQIDPIDVTGGQPVALAWFSPDCKHFSKAKGGKPREKSIRDLAWVVVLWGKRVRPDVILLENVEEFRTWGPLDADGRPIKSRAGETFERWCRELRKLGYRLQFRQLRACDYGAPTIRKRFFMIARCDGRPIVWPKPTHGRPDSPEVRAGKLRPWRTAAEIIDWSIPCPSIFERRKPLADKTLRRIAHGTVKFVLRNPKPFIVGCGGRRGQSPPCDIDRPYPTTTAKADACLVSPLFARTAHGEVDRAGKRRGQGAHSAEAPFPTIATSQDSALVVGTLVQTSYGERVGQAPRALDIARPLGTVVAGGNKFAAVAAFLSHQYGSATNGGQGDPEQPLKTVTTGGHHAIVCAHVEQANGGPRNGRLAGRGADRPLSTVTVRGTQQRLIETTLVAADALPPELLGRAVRTAAFLVKYYGTDQDPRLEEPLHSVTTKDRFAVVTVLIDAETYILVDIGMRMLTPRELFNAQGFPPDYIIERDAAGLHITKTAQVAKCGNSVCPPIAEALVRANCADLAAEPEEMAA